MTQAPKVIWRNVAFFVVVHAFALHGLYYLLTLQTTFKTFLWYSLLCFCSSQGAATGSHRLWSHRSYKAKLPLRILLCLFHTLAFQDNIYVWVRDHRSHHKYTDTDGDPYNSTRGVFFAHIGWLLTPKHPDVVSKGKSIDMSDVEADPVVRFQRKYYLILVPIVCFIIPTVVPWYFWGENLYVAWCVPTMLRYMLSLQVTFLINSAAHMWGTKPYNKSINPVENPWVAILTFGEGWHNYHHTFPWDYKAAELGPYSSNMNTAFIDFMAWIGWAYDRKEVPADAILRHIARIRSVKGSESIYKTQDNPELY